MKPNIIADHEFGDMSAIYYEKDGQTSLMIIPAEMRDDVKEAKLLITESLVQAHVDGDKWVAPYSRGISMRNTETSMELRFTWQEVIEIDGVKTVITYLDDPRGRRAVHRLTYSNGGFFKVETSFVNTGSEPFELMMLSSFSLTGISPFVDGQAENSLFLHRFRSYWSAEGRHIKESIEDLGLEPSWSNWATKCEKFYQTGSMPIRKFFPICGIEDIESGVTWAAELEWAGSWQIEPYRRNAAMCLSGGLADKDTGGWSVVLNPGEEFTSIPSCITVVKGSINDACDRLLENSRVDYNNVPESEYELPVIYNEYCDTWGNPTRDKILSQLDSLEGLGIKYFVIDAGWYASVQWHGGQGDWDVDLNSFPNGMLEMTERIRERGYVPGIWFEWERAGNNSQAYKNKRDQFIKYNGKVIESNSGTFFDLRKSEVKEYFENSVKKFLKVNGFGYLKIDYNESLGAEIDGDSTSGGENLRKHINAFYDYLDSLKRDIPELVVENCASGGHRLESSIMKRTSMSSFSDAHECIDIPIIAANLHNLIQPSQSQIWVVLHSEDSIERFYYSLVSSFLGRMCISGKIYDLSACQIDTIRRAIAFYNKCVPVIRSGRTRTVRSKFGNYSFPKGYQVSFRISDDMKEAIAVIHCFEGAKSNQYEISHNFLEGMKMLDVFCQDEFRIDFNGSVLSFEPNKDFTAAVAYFSYDDE